MDYTSITYRHIHRFSVETAGHSDMDAELEIWVAGHIEPIKKLRKGIDVNDVQALIAPHRLVRRSVVWCNRASKARQMANTRTVMLGLRCLNEDRADGAM